MFVTTGGLWVESLVCSVAFGRTRVVISKAFSLVGLPLFWVSCSIWSRDLLGHFGQCLLVFLDLLTSLFKLGTDEATGNLRELTSMWFIGS